MLNCEPHEKIQYEYDDGSTELLTGDQVLEAYMANMEAIAFFDDVDRGMIHMTLAEYRELPALFLETRRIFINQKTRIIKKHKRQHA